MTAITCSRVTPAFTVRMTITPVVGGETACAWATDGWVMEVAPVRVRVSAKATLRSAFIGLVSRVTAVTFVLALRCRTAFGERLFPIMLTSHEAPLHSQARCARRRGGVPERCPAPQFPPSGRRTRGDAVGHQSGGTRPRGTPRRSAVHPHDAQCRPDRSRGTIPFACKARLRGTRRRNRRRA